MEALRRQSSNSSQQIATPTYPWDKKNLAAIETWLSTAEHTNINNDEFSCICDTIKQLVEQEAPKYAQLVTILNIIQHNKMAAALNSADSNSPFGTSDQSCITHLCNTIKALAKHSYNDSCLEQFQNIISAFSNLILYPNNDSSKPLVIIISEKRYELFNEVIKVLIEKPKIFTNKNGEDKNGDFLYNIQKIITDIFLGMPLLVQNQTNAVANITPLLFKFVSNISPIANSGHLNLIFNTLKFIHDSTKISIDYKEYSNLVKALIEKHIANHCEIVVKIALLYVKYSTTPNYNNDTKTQLELKIKNSLDVLITMNQTLRKNQPGSTQNSVLIVPIVASLINQEIEYLPSKKVDSFTKFDAFIAICYINWMENLDNTEKKFSNNTNTSNNDKNISINSFAPFTSLELINTKKIDEYINWNADWSTIKIMTTIFAMNGSNTNYNLSHLCTGLQNYIVKFKKDKLHEIADLLFILCSLTSIHKYKEDEGPWELASRLIPVVDLMLYIVKSFDNYKEIFEPFIHKIFLLKKIDNEKYERCQTFIVMLINYKFCCNNRNYQFDKQTQPKIKVILDSFGSSYEKNKNNNSK